MIGAVFAPLVFWHFFSDWTFQSQWEAMNKARNKKVRAWHCMKYAAFFLPMFLFTGFTDVTWLVCALTILGVTHYIIDSYVPVMLWAKYCRKTPEFKRVGIKSNMKPWSDHDVDEVYYSSDMEAFKAFASTPLGLILIITMDQLMHIACLIPIAWMMISL